MAKKYGFSDPTAEELREAYDVFNVHLKKNGMRKLMFRGPIDEAKMKKAFRKLALIYHPDRNPDNQSSMEERQKEVFNAFNLFKQFFSENERYDPATYRDKRGGPSRARPRPAAEDRFWKRGVGRKRDQAFMREMEQYEKTVSPSEIDGKLERALSILWSVLEGTGVAPKEARRYELENRRLSSSYNLQAELSYAQRRYDKAKIEYFLEAVYLVLEASAQRNWSELDEKLLLASAREALLNAAKSAHYDGKGNTKALWLLARNSSKSVELLRKKLEVEVETRGLWDRVSMDRASWGLGDDDGGGGVGKGILDGLSDFGSDIKHSVLKGLRKLINR